MFCNEPIEEVFCGHTKTEEPLPNSFLDCYFELAYHVEQGECLLFSTKNYVITVDGNGASLSPKPIVLKENQWLDPAVDKGKGTGKALWVEIEATLFVGERLLEVQKTDEFYLLKFDDFELKVIPYERGEMKKDLYVEHYQPILGCDRLLKRKCECGSEGEIFIDFVSDFIVCCKRCKKSTWAGMNLIDAIDDWNKGETPIMLDML